MAYGMTKVAANGSATITPQQEEGQSSPSSLYSPTGGLYGRFS
jgi:hypothetical protein